METMTVEKITVDVCNEGCGGIWFDRFELSHFDEPDESGGEILENIRKDPTVKVDLKARRKCPRDGTIMMQHFFSVKKQVTVDECPQCAGFWLDAGELTSIRHEYTSEKERQKAAEKYFGEIFGKQLKDLHDKSEKDKVRAQKIARMFRFLCPSYYIPGKQDGGAF
jgi:Zn-finger nucleic acid-binding protein